jgi:hypothetical protein
MKRIAALALVAAAFAVPAAEAQAAQQATPTLKQFQALQKQVTKLQAQVKTLQKFVPAACTAQTCFTLAQLSNIANFQFAYAVCQDAVISDQFQATWNVIDQISTATQAGKTYFGPQTSITDSGSCASLRFTRPAVVPPTSAIFSSLVTLLTG